MRESAAEPLGEEGVDAVRSLADLAARLARSSAPMLLASAEALRAAHAAALAIPRSFSHGREQGAGERALLERSIRAELAVALGVSERTASRRLEHAQLLLEHLPRTRDALANARILWEAGEVICDGAGSVPVASRADFDERAAEAALAMTPTQLRRVVARLREELHDQSLAARHARARETRSVWVRPEIDGMATLCALLPASVALGVFSRLDRIALAVRDSAPEKDGGEQDRRTLPQLHADALADLLSDGDVVGTTPDGARADATFVPGVRPEVRLTLAASTVAGLDDAPAHVDGYGLVPAETARELVGVATTVTRVLTDPDTGAVTSVGRTHRVPPAQMRLHLQLRDQTCRFPGCIRTATTAEADHVVEWHNGGDTALENLASLCVAHHHVRHGDRWSYVLRPDGRSEWTTPTGRRVVTRPPLLPGRPPGPLAGRSSEEAPPPD